MINGEQVINGRMIFYRVYHASNCAIHLKYLIFLDASVMCKLDIVFCEGHVVIVILYINGQCDVIYVALGLLKCIEATEMIYHEHTYLEKSLVLESFGNDENGNVARKI